MYCSQCGKQIPDQSKFCSYCGAQVYGVRPAANPVQQRPAAANPVQQQRPVAPNPVQQQPAAAPKKQGGWGSRILTILVAAIVFTGAKYITENVLFEKNNDSAFEQGFKEALTADSDVSDAMDSCARGAIYKDGYVRYGLSRLYMPGYSLISGEGDTRDWLMSPDEALLFCAYKQLEIMEVSYDASNEEGMLNSYKSSYSDATIIDYQKYHVNDFPVIRYIVAYTADGEYQYQGEMIVFPSETTDETIRLALFADPASGCGQDEINQVFDTLQVSTDYKVTEVDTNVIGFNRITVK